MSIMQWEMVETKIQIIDSDGRFRNSFTKKLRIVNLIIHKRLSKRKMTGATLIGFYCLEIIPMTNSKTLFT